MIGLVVNPVAGIGGPAGLAGSDGGEVQRIARERGSIPRASDRAAVALSMLPRGMTVVTAAGAMGEDAVRSAGLVPRVVYEPAASTTADDTRNAVQALVEDGASLILFAGGDGTARDVLGGLVGGTVATLGIPAGVKMYSAVFAVSPRAAGAVALAWSNGDLPVDRREVLDIDEHEMRRARVQPRLFGELAVPFLRGRTQARKTPTPASEQAAAAAAARGALGVLEPGVSYLVGPGSTMAELTGQLGLEGSALGVDVIRDGRIVTRDASERQLLAAVADGPAKAIVTIIGGQGFLLGRGNQQLSARVVRAIGIDPLIVVAPESKLVALQGRPLLVDTGDLTLDAELSGYARIITGASTSSLYPVRSPEHTECQP